MGLEEQPQVLLIQIQFSKSERHRSGKNVGILLRWEGYHNVGGTILGLLRHDRNL